MHSHFPYSPTASVFSLWVRAGSRSGAYTATGCWVSPFFPLRAPPPLLTAPTPVWLRRKIASLSRRVYTFWIFASLSFNRSQCILAVRPRGLLKFLSEFDKDTSQGFWVLPPGGTRSRFFLSLWSQQLLIALPPAERTLGLQNGDIVVLWPLLHLLAGTLLQRETLPQQRALVDATSKSKHGSFW